MIVYNITTPSNASYLFLIVTRIFFAVSTMVIQKVESLTQKGETGENFCSRNTLPLLLEVEKKLIHIFIMCQWGPWKCESYKTNLKSTKLWPEQS